jgi:hypothetical protein
VSWWEDVGLSLSWLVESHAPLALPVQVLLRRWLTAVLALLVVWYGGLWALASSEASRWHSLVWWGVIFGGGLFYGATLLLLGLTGLPSTWAWWW